MLSAILSTIILLQINSANQSLFTPTDKAPDMGMYWSQSVG